MAKGCPDDQDPDELRQDSPVPFSGCMTIRLLATVPRHPPRWTVIEAEISQI
jgi:hypothetical protein